jgi:DNA repair exonuclease SbcCD ATPase subunit
MRPTRSSLIAAAVAITTALVAREAAAKTKLEQAIEHANTVERELRVTLTGTSDERACDAAEVKLKAAAAALAAMIDEEGTSLAVVGVAGESKRFTVASERATAVTKAKTLKTQVNDLLVNVERRQDRQHWAAKLTTCQRGGAELRSAVTSTLANAVRQVKARAASATSGIEGVLQTLHEQATRLEASLDEIDRDLAALKVRSDRHRGEIEAIEAEIQRIAAESAAGDAAQQRKAERIAAKRRELEAKTAENDRVEAEIDRANVARKTADQELDAAHARFLEAADDAAELQYAGHWERE